MCLICRPRCNVLPTFVLPRVCIFGSTPTPRCSSRASSADTIFQPQTCHVLLSLANFLSPHCLRWETLAGATAERVRFMSTVVRTCWTERIFFYSSCVKRPRGHHEMAASALGKVAGAGFVFILMEAGLWLEK